MMDISVLLPVRNAEETVESAIENVLSQSCENFELLIMNIGSSDKSGKLIRSFKDTRIRILAHEADYTKACNNAVTLSKGKYICRINTEVILHKCFLEKQYVCMETHEDIVACGVNSKNINNYNLWDATVFPVNSENMQSSMLTGNPEDYSCFLIRRDILSNSKPTYDKRLIPLLQDFKLCFELTRKGKIAIIPETLLLHTSVKNHNAAYFSGLNELRQEIAQYFADLYGITFNEAEIFDDMAFQSVKNEIDGIGDSYVQEKLSDFFRNKTDLDCLKSIQNMIVS
jgi:glycosyltransferase involved in cell wall biosynthesis